MISKLEVDLESNIPIYKQIISNIHHLIDTGVLKKGDYVPSLNDLSKKLQISKETVKKAYLILRDNEVLESTQGKGYYVSKEGNGRIKILLLLDMLSTYKHVLLNSFYGVLGNKAEINIRLFNQDIEVFEYFLDQVLDSYDYYVITPHFPLDSVIQTRAINALGRVPNRKLLLLDRNIFNLPGNFSAVYQDYERDIYDGLFQGLKEIKRFNKLNIIAMPSSLYASFIIKGIIKFCVNYVIDYEIISNISSKRIQKNEVYLILNSQMDNELINLIRVAKQKGYEIGRDIGLISYNESPINEIILNGLSVLSTDFSQMGRIAAEMILEKSIRKIKCDFKLIRRSTF